MPRYVRDEERIARAIDRTRRGVADVQRPTGTERRRTADVAEQAAEDSEFAKQLAEQLELELGPLPGQIQSALDDAAAALSEAGLARSEAATAVSDAAEALAEAELAIKDVAGSVKGVNLAGESVTAEKIFADAVTAVKLAANAVTAVKIAANAVTAEKINAGAVTTTKLDALAVTSEKIAAGAIIADKIAANAITTAKLAADAIDGMTITGALIRTAASGARMQFDVNGLRGFNASDVETVRLRVNGDGLELTQDADYAKAILGLSANKTFGALISALSQTQNASFSLSAEGNAAGLIIGSTAGPGGGSSVIIAADGSQNWVRSDSYRNGTGALSAPYASAGGVVPKQAIAPAAATSVTVTFPPSRFTVAPIVTTGLWGAAKDCAVNVDEITSTSCKIWLGSNSAASRTFGAQWQAVQMLATSASG